MGGESALRGAGVHPDQCPSFKGGVGLLAIPTITTAPTLLEGSRCFGSGYNFIPHW
jgi:hypothetical protein